MTQATGRNATSMDGGQRVFPISFRELAAVTNVKPPVHYHALLADELSRTHVVVLWTLKLRQGRAAAALTWRWATLG